ncbi:MAG: phosphodiester glycosidase family protein [Deltaproteobacteria bacterium]|nr:phosphodiester glycosidase family protein [Deltaproteobacteria bacterium]
MIEPRLKIRGRISFLLFWVILSLPGIPATADDRGWENLDTGLQIGEFFPKEKSLLWNDKIIILRIDPEFYDLKLLCASEHDGSPRSAKKWCQDFHLAAAINASMYQDENALMSTGYMKNFHHVNNPSINEGFGALLLFNPSDPDLPRVDILDRRINRDWRTIMDRYRTVVQNYRMISSGEKRGWPQQKRGYSIASLGMDAQGRVLFILGLAPRSAHDFIINLLSLPLDIREAMYLEGGHEATLYLNIGTKTLWLTGGHDTDFGGDDEAEGAGAIPNVIGIAKRR